MPNPPTKQVFKLLQHTPLIHFQADQDGANLRMTEVKPKLDRWLNAYFEQNGIPDWQYRVGYQEMRNPEPEKAAYDYRLRVVALDPLETWEIKPSGNVDPILPHQDKYPLYFADLGQTERSATKQFTYAERQELRVVCFHPDLMEAIKTNLADFLLHHNFGNRQSKGFGSFYLDPADEAYQPPKLRYAFSLQTVTSDDAFKRINRMFARVNLLYRALRGGINLPRGQVTGYFKSMLWWYAKEQGWQWEKKSIKQAYFHQELSSQQTDHGNPDILTYKAGSQAKDGYLIRDLLGLSTEQSWHTYGETIEKVHVRPDKKGGWEPVPTDDPSHIARFPSPLFFKPIRNEKGTFVVHFKANSIPRAFLDAHFLVRRKGNRRDDLVLKAPPNFSVEAYLDALFDAKATPIHQLKDPRDLVSDTNAQKTWFNELDIKIIKKIRKNAQKP